MTSPSYYQANRALEATRNRRYLMQAKYGLTVEQYEELLATQGGVCAICGLPESATRNGKVKRLAVDHDHETNAVRGLLCQACNTAIGLLNNDPGLARKAAAYCEEA